MQERRSPPYEGGDKGVVINKKHYLLFLRKKEADEKAF